MRDSESNDLRRVHERRLNEIASARLTHPEVAAAAALDYCAEFECAPPRWVVSDCAKSLSELLIRQKTSKRGRARGLVARYRQDQIDLERWDEVLTARSNQKRVAERVRRLDEYPAIKEKHPKRFQHEMKLLNWLGRSWDRAYEVAAMHLTGTEAYAGPDAMKASYKRVQKGLRSNEGAARYIRFHDEFLAKIGINKISQRKKGIKMFPIYNLTLPL